MSILLTFLPGACIYPDILNIHGPGLSMLPAKLQCQVTLTIKCLYTRALKMCWVDQSKTFLRNSHIHNQNSQKHVVLHDVNTLHSIMLAILAHYVEGTVLHHVNHLNTLYSVMLTIVLHPYLNTLYSIMLATLAHCTPHHVDYPNIL